MKLLVLYCSLVIVTFIALFTKQDSYNYKTEDNKITLIMKSNLNDKIILFIILLILTVFAGFRTEYNDTLNYINSYIYEIPASISFIKYIDFSLGKYPGFIIFQIIIKSIFGNNPQIFIFISSLISISLFILFFYRYSKKFSLSIYLFLTTGLYFFGMAAIKQVLAMGIGLLGTKYILEKKWIKYLSIIFIASTLHPFAIMFLILPIISDKVWTKKIVISLIIVIISLFNFETLITNIVLFGKVLGKEYNISSFLDSEGMNFIRIVVLSITPILSFLFRKKINKKRDPILHMSINASIISLILIIPGALGGANLFGRLSFYFYPFNIIALNSIIYSCFNKTEQKIVLFFCIVLYFIFFSYTKGSFNQNFQHLLF